MRKTVKRKIECEDEILNTTENSLNNKIVTCKKIVLVMRFH